MSCCLWLQDGVLRAVGCLTLVLPHAPQRTSRGATRTRTGPRPALSLAPTDGSCSAKAWLLHPHGLHNYGDSKPCFDPRSPLSSACNPIPASCSGESQRCSQFYTTPHSKFPPLGSHFSPLPWKWDTWDIELVSISFNGAVAWGWKICWQPASVDVAVGSGLGLGLSLGLKLGLGLELGVKVRVGG